jgi:putative transcriptional regulator
MSAPQHHLTAEYLAAYAHGALAAPFAVVVATHVSMCDECRAAWEAAALPGGLLLEAQEAAALSPGFRERVLGALDEVPALRGDAPIVFPAPLHEALGRRPPRWRRIAPGTRQAILQNDAEGSLRLLEFPARTAVPEHGHRGREMTLVLRGAFSDVTGTYGVGDVQVAGGDLEHAPTATSDGPCLCLAATDAPLRFKGLVPRLLQPILRI